jgi:hypothetical protein
MYASLNHTVVQLFYARHAWRYACDVACMYVCMLRSIVHGSNANRSARRRGGLTIRYIPTSAPARHMTGTTRLFLPTELSFPGTHALRAPSFDA